MIREEKVIVGTQEEIEAYYLERLKESKTDINGNVIVSCREYLPFKVQIEEIKKKGGFGILYYFKTGLGPTLSLEKIFVFIQPSQGGKR